MCTLLTSPTGLAQTLNQCWMLRIDAQAHDMHRVTNEGHRNLDACEVSHAQRFGGTGGTFLSTQFIVVGQRPQLYPIGVSTQRQRFRRQCSIGNHGVAMQVGVL